MATGRLDRVEFVPRADWKIIRTFDRKAAGSLRSRPYEIRGRWYNGGGERSLFVFGAAAQKPFGTLADRLKREAGQILLKAYQDGR